MAALAYDLPGLQATPMARETPYLSGLLRDAQDWFEWNVLGRYIAMLLAQASAIPEADRRAARHAQLRERFRRAQERHVSLMEASVRGLNIARPFAPGPALARIEGPDFRDDGLLLYVPGGSFVVERSPLLTAMIARIAAAARINAAVCDYRLAPENPCPAAIDDVELGFESITALGLAPARIVIVAESAGAAIALAAVQRLAARGRSPGGLVLLSPWIDCDPDRADLNPVARQCARLFLSGADPRDPSFNPVHGSMRGLPPIAIHANRRDTMFADAESLARRAAAAGVPVELRYWPGRLHVIERRDDAEARRSIAEIAAFIGRQLTTRRRAA